MTNFEELKKDLLNGRYIRVIGTKFEIISKGLYLEQFYDHKLNKELYGDNFPMSDFLQKLLSRDDLELVPENEEPKYWKIEDIKEHYKL